ncbi:MAG: MFS transporter [Acidobacteriia bacterium]|nr:MFS transporter [Terriglobia bacterium]
MATKTSAAVTTDASLAAPTRTRYVVIAYGMTLSFITFLDRAAIGQAAPLIRRDLGLTAVEMGYIFSAFGLAYALLEIPAGMYGDWKGPRKVLTQIVVAWSVFTIATGWAWNFISMWTTRLLFGAAEAGCYPGLARLFRTWLPVRERPVAEGLKAASARLGAAVAPSLVVFLYAFMSWKNVFLALGLVGFAWAGAFYWWFRDAPSQHASVNAMELAMIPVADQGHGHGGAPWRDYIVSRSLWMLCVQWFCHFYGFYFYITWLPTYLQEARGVDVTRSAVLSGFPLLMAALGSLAGGWATSALIRRFDMRRARKMVCYVSYAGAAILMVLAIRADSVMAAIALMSFSSFSVELSVPASWTTAMDLGGRHVGAVSGAMNTIGQLGGVVAPAVVGFVAQGGKQGWSAALYTAAAVYAIGFFCWLFLDPVTPLDRSARA